jgi:hypothetical protein
MVHAWRSGKQEPSSTGMGRQVKYRRESLVRFLKKLAIYPAAQT